MAATGIFVYSIISSEWNGTNQELFNPITPTTTPGNNFLTLGTITISGTQNVSNRLNITIPFFIGSSVDDIKEADVGLEFNYGSGGKLISGLSPTNTDFSSTEIISFDNIPLKGNGNQFRSFNGIFNNISVSNGTIGVPLLLPHDNNGTPEFSCSAMFNSNSFNEDVNSWDMSNVTDMSFMFIASPFNNNISSWNVSNVTTMKSMFQISEFNQNINSWNVSNVIDMSDMFRAGKFNQDISSWTLTSLDNASGMFVSNDDFNQNISSWNTNSITNMNFMFAGANSFNQDIGNWDFTNVSQVSDMFTNTGYNPQTASQLILSMSKNQTILNNPNNYGNIGPSITPLEFINIPEITSALNILTINTVGIDNIQTTVPLPTSIEIFKYTIENIDDTELSKFRVSNNFNPFKITNISYANNEFNFYCIDNTNAPINNKIEYSFYINILDSQQKTSDDGLIFNNTFMTSPNVNLSSNQINSIEIIDINNIPLQNNGGQFEGFNGIFPNNSNNKPDLSSVTIATNMFKDSNSSTLNVITNWVLSNIENTSNMFENAINFNTNIGNTDLSNLTTTNDMFLNSGLTQNTISNLILSISKNITLNNKTLDFGTLPQLILGAPFIIQALNELSDININNNQITFGTTQTDNFNGIELNYTVTRDSGSAIGKFANNINIYNPVSTGTYITNNSNYSCIESQTETLIYLYNIDTNNNITSNQGLAFNNVFKSTNFEQQEYDSIVINYFNNIPLRGDGNQFNSFKGTFDTNSGIPLLLPNINNIFSALNMFADSNFNGDIINWNVSSVTDMTSMFLNARFNQNINNWDVSNVTNMSSMFLLSTFNQNINNWNVSKVTNMSNMFNGTQFNQNINNWDVSKVNDMSNMFSQSLFNQDISNWDVSDVNNMSNMFSDSQFNQNINNWNVSKVNDMSNMFNNSQFNQNINVWNVSNVINMTNMFFNSQFNQNINDWNVINVTNFTGMFSNSPFDKDIGIWDFTNAITVSGMFTNAGYEQLELSQLILTLSKNNSLTNGTKNLNFFIIGQTSPAVIELVNTVEINSALDTLTTNNILITNTISTDLLSTNIRRFNYTINNISDSEISKFQNKDNFNPFTIIDKSPSTNFASNLYSFICVDKTSSPNDNILEYFYYYDLTELIQNNVPISNNEGLSFNDDFMRSNNLTLQQINSVIIKDLTNIPIKNNGGQFEGFNGIMPNSLSNIPDLTHVTNFNDTFKNTSGNGLIGINNWDTSNIITFRNTFDSSVLIPVLSSWNMSNAEDLTGMFRNTDNLSTADINSWDVSNVEVMSEMFSDSEVFINLSGWSDKLNKVFDMSGMFRNTGSLINTGIELWNVSNVIDMSNMFSGSTMNLNLNNWERTMPDFSSLHNVSNMTNMFSEATQFNQDISNWNVSNVNIMFGMFESAITFNQNLRNWDVRNVRNMVNLFSNASSFNQNIGNWNFTDLSDASDMFISSNLSQQTVNTMVFEMAKNGILNTKTLDFGTLPANFINVPFVSEALNELSQISFGSTGLDSFDGVEFRYKIIRDSSSNIGKFANNLNLYNPVSTGTYLINNSSYSCINNFDETLIYLYNIDTNETKTDNEGLAFNDIFRNNNFIQSEFDSVIIEHMHNIPLQNNGAQFRTFSGTIPDDINNVPDLNKTTICTEMFKNSTSTLNGIDNWVMSNIIDMSSMFESTNNFNIDISSWNVSNVQNMSRMFFGSSMFNQNISSWRPNNLLDISFMFANTEMFDKKSINNWDLSQLTNSSNSLSNSNLSIQTFTDLLIDLSNNTTLQSNPNSLSLNTITQYSLPDAMPFVTLTNSMNPQIIDNTNMTVDFGGFITQDEITDFTNATKIFNNDNINIDENIQFFTDDGGIEEPINNSFTARFNFNNQDNLIVGNIHIGENSNDKIIIREIDSNNNSTIIFETTQLINIVVLTINEGNSIEIEYINNTNNSVNNPDLQNSSGFFFEMISDIITTTTTTTTPTTTPTTTTPTTTPTPTTTTPTTQTTTTPTTQTTTTPTTQTTTQTTTTSTTTSTTTPTTQTTTQTTTTPTTQTTTTTEQPTTIIKPGLPENPKTKDYNILDDTYYFEVDDKVEVIYYFDV